MKATTRKATTAEQEDSYGREDGKRQTKQRDLELAGQRKAKVAVRQGA